MPILWQGWPRCGRCGIAVGVLLFAACNSGPTEPTLGTSWVAITAGYHHTCALTDAERAFCWGENSAGQLGVPASDTGLATPTPVETTLRFIALSAGRTLTCGVTTELAVYCWGEDAQQGRGSSQIPICERAGVTGPCPHLPVRIESDAQFIDVTVAGTYEHWDGSLRGGPVCAVTPDGNAYCWGYGAFGARGDGTTKTSAVPSPLAGDLQFTQIAVSDGGGCGIAVSGELYCWGTNAYHRLGRSDRAYSAVPLEIPAQDTWASVDVGPTHTCAVTTAGEGRCWGVNDYGVLGDGTEVDRVTPTTLLGDLNLVSVVPSYYHTCALEDGGRSYCWGYSTLTGTGAHVLDWRILGAAPVAWSQMLVGISLGEYHTCGVTRGGDAFCWGEAWRGQLGTGDKQYRSLPARVPPP